MDYKLISFKDSDFKDQHNNTWCDAAFEGISEPVKWVVKDPSRIVVGNTYHGEIKDATSKAGKPYRRFYAQKREEPTYQKTEQGDEYWKERNDAIKAQFAIKTAVALLRNPEAEVDEAIIEHWSNIFFKMVDRVATGKPTEKKPDEIIDDIGDEPINLDDIPF